MHDGMFEENTIHIVGINGSLVKAFCVLTLVLSILLVTRGHPNVSHEPSGYPTRSSMDYTVTCFEPKSIIHMGSKIQIGGVCGYYPQTAPI